MTPTIISTVFPIELVYIKKAYIGSVLSKLLKINYRTNELIKNPFKDGALLQLRLIPLKEYSVEFTKKYNQCRQ